MHAWRIRRGYSENDTRTGMYHIAALDNQRKSGLSLTCFFMRNNIVVYHWSSREIESYSFTASENPSLLLSSKCSIRVCKNWIK